MSFGFSVGDIIAITKIARDIWKNFEQSTDQIANLYLLLDDVGQTIGVQKLNKKQQQDLSSLVQGCRDVFTDLQVELSKFQDLDVKHKRLGAKPHIAWRKLSWDPEIIESYRIRIISNTTLLNAYNSSVASKLSSAIRDDVARVDKGVEGLQVKQNHQEEQKIIEWLSPLNFYRTQIDVYGRQQDGTGQWLLKLPEFKDWVSGNKGRLWCPGIPGAGKTILSSIVINYLHSALKSPDVAIAWIYCDYKQQITQTLENLLGSLLKQLTQQKFALPKTANALYKAHERLGTRPSRTDLMEALESEILGFSKMYIIVDALDECSDSSGTRSDLLEGLQSLPGNINLMVTSRYIPSIERELGQAKRIDIHAKEEDLRIYVNGRIHRERRLLQHVRSDPSLEELIVSKRTGNVAGMFLLAQLHIDSLVSKNNRKAVREVLANLPIDLDNTYEEAMARINGQCQEDIDLAEKVLLWIAYARRPLSIKELQHAVAISDEDTETEFEAFPD